MKIQLNCDLGESFGSWKMGMDDAIMPFIDSANIACGFHASDPVIMQYTVELAIKNGVSIGAHPGYPDLVGFGRRSMKCSSLEIEAMVIYQCGALEAICKSNNTKIEYVKPHGALYNDMMKDEDIFIALVKALSKYNKNLKLMILSTNNNAHYEKIAKSYGVGLIYEVFADRAYTNEGLLVPRVEKGSVIESKDEIIERIKMLQEEKKLKTISGEIIAMQADSMCVHGDNQKAVDLVKALREYIS
ncbi:5-oxoprolinase subunit PxpA [Sulfurospirillum arcachonense]|uniref:5-oxoprolinase subunit PxpA n=1 Tax=Sulfurospirillum arcachonense TaxID=57666 RepID=UPI00046A7691|nr:5-oxoprolinase subunit PxpA [Sulfurospirillum arcachonense]